MSCPPCRPKFRPFRNVFERAKPLHELRASLERLGHVGMRAGKQTTERAHKMVEMCRLESAQRAQPVSGLFGAGIQKQADDARRTAHQPCRPLLLLRGAASGACNILREQLDLCVAEVLVGRHDAQTFTNRLFDPGPVGLEFVQ